VQFHMPVLGPFHLHTQGTCLPARHPNSRRARLVAAVLRKGDAFGDGAMLDGACRSTAAVPASMSATLLVVERRVRLTPLASA
jgi:hypothetical protein